MGIVLELCSWESSNVGFGGSRPAEIWESRLAPRSARSPGHQSKDQNILPWEHLQGKYEQIYWKNSFLSPDWYAEPQ